MLPGRHQGECEERWQTNRSRGLPPTSRYFPSIERKYGRPINEWQELIRQKLPAKHMELVAMLKNDHGMGHGHANALVAHTLSTQNT